MESGPGYTNADPSRSNTESESGFSDIPIEPSLVETVAMEHDLEIDVLSKVLGDVTSRSNHIDVGFLFSQFDPKPVATMDDEWLYLVATEDVCWDTVEAELGITETTRRAVAKSHDEQVSKAAKTWYSDSGCGLGVRCKAFPSTAIAEIHHLLNRTSLSATEATIKSLYHHSQSVDRVAEILRLPTSIVEVNLKAIQRQTRQAITAAKALDSGHDTLSQLNPIPSSSGWMGLKWSQWLDLHAIEQLRENIDRRPGVYRVRHSDRDGLLYIGETTDLDDRVTNGLAKGINSSEEPQGGNHDATPRLWRVADVLGPGLEVSVATPPFAADKRHRRGLEATLVSIARRELGQTPTVMLHRWPTADSDGSIQANHNDGLAAGSDQFLPPLEWTAWRAVTSGDWMGLEWTDPLPLTERSDFDGVNHCIYRVWSENGHGSEWDRSLRYIGTTESPVARFFNLAQQYDSDTRISVAELNNMSTDDVERQREFEEAKYDLLGAHYLATGAPPKDQF